MFKPFLSLYAQPGQVANTRIALVIGVSLSLDITFAKEQVATQLGTDASTRIRVLRREWKVSGGMDVKRRSLFCWRGKVTAADGTSKHPFGAGDGNALLTSTNYVPAGTTVLHITWPAYPSSPLQDPSSRTCTMVTRSSEPQRNSV